MRWIDLLRMSSGNLKRRKLRTLLTVLGVVIGIASITVMISLGLGMQRSMYKMVETSGGLTDLKVIGNSENNSSSSPNGGTSKGSEEEKYLTKEVIEGFKSLDNILEATPMLQMSVLIKKGNYIAYTDLLGVKPSALANQKLELEKWGKLPEQGSLNIVMGNMVPQFFNNEKTGEGYWETGKLPNINFEKDQLFLILDQEAYLKGQENKMGSQKTDEADGKIIPKVAKKYAIRVSALLSGGMDNYNANSYTTLCNLDALETALKKEFSGRVIPGQPSTKSGKPLKYMVYSAAAVQVDDIKNVEAVSTEIRNMGYEVESNAEYLNSMKQQMAMVQAVLGGIGAISMLVAAIGIANTMMMSIYERSKEIGVIKVLGCSLRNIQQLFLLEAGMLGVIGGVIGNILGVMISLIINAVVGGFGSEMQIDKVSYIPFWLVLGTILFAIFASMVAGYFPALRAMKLSPLAAIRTE